MKKTSTMTTAWGIATAAIAGPAEHANIMAVMSEGGPFHTRGYLEKYCTHLEETGRGDLAEKLKAKYPEALRDNY